MIDWLTINDLLAAGYESGKGYAARERELRRLAGSASSMEAMKIDGTWHFSPDYLLPNNLTVASLLAVGTVDKLKGKRLPPGHETWTERDRQRFIDTYDLLDRFDTERAAWRLLPESKVIQIVAGKHGKWAADRGLSINLRAMARYRRRLDPSSPLFDGNVDGRGRAKAPDETRFQVCTPEAWQAFESLFLDTNQLSVAEAHRIIQAESKRRGWAWPSLRTIQQRAKHEIPEAIKTYGRQGKRRYAADCLPKIRREYGDVPAGSHICGDERTCDFWVRVPCSRRGWRAIRPKITAWLDVRSRMVWGWIIGELANSDTILAAFKAGAKTFGLPLEATVDNGADYRAVGGKKRRKWADFDTRRIGTVFEQTGITAHYAIPYQPWSKLIESFFGTMAGQFDKHQAAYCGGKPDDKPADMADRIGDVMSLPTLNDVRSAFDAWLKVYHATPHSGDGMNGLSPQLCRERNSGPIRTCASEVLDLLCGRMVGPVKVGRDGIRWRGIVYGQLDEEVFILQGRKVWLRIDPDQADSVVICDKKGTPICVASNRRLRGATQEDVRKAAQYRGRLTKTVKEYMKNRLDLLDTRPESIMALKRAAADAAEAEIRKRLPAVENKPEIVIVRPDLHEPAAKISRQKRATALVERATPNGGDHGESPLDALVRAYGKSPQPNPATELPVFDWATYGQKVKNRDGNTDVSASEGFERLAERNKSAIAG